MDQYKTAVNIALLINSFDSFYEMSDDPRVWDNGNTSKQAIKNLLEDLEEEHLEDLIMNLNDAGKISYERYFSGK